LTKANSKTNLSWTRSNLVGIAVKMSRKSGKAAGVTK